MMTHQQAKAEAERCLYCFDAPCTQACPTHIDIPGFISMIRSNNIRGAAEVVKSANAFANVCGKVCPEEIYCQSVCNRSSQDTPINIRDLHFYATQHEARDGYSATLKFTPRKKTIGVIGGGPSGFGCAFELAKMGYQVTMFDGKGPGGVPKNSIPAFRLTERELRDDLDFLARHVTIKREHVTPAKFRTLKKKFDAMFLGIGLGKDRSLSVKGEQLKGVVPVLEFLEEAKRKRVSVGKHVVVIGGGNVSLDAAATAKRLGASDVTLVYRRGEHEMKVWKNELEEARKQGVDIRFLTMPIEILGKKNAQGVRCRKTRLSGKKDSSGRPIPVEIPGSEFVLEASTVIIAIGQLVGAEVSSQFEKNNKGFVTVNKNFKTSDPKVFAGGDVISGEGTIVQSVAHGKQAAHAIHAFLGKN